jgi:ubiquinone biosynthesis monooxygenase Coq7
MRQRRLSLLDRLITEADSAMRTITNSGHAAARPSPSQGMTIPDYRIANGNMPPG